MGSCEGDPHEEGLEVAFVHQDNSNRDSWNKSKFEEFNNFLGFSIMGMKKEIQKNFKKYRSRGRRSLTNHGRKRPNLIGN